MNIVLRLMAADGSSETVVIEAGSRFVVPSGVGVQLVSVEGADQVTVENGELVLTGAAGEIRIAGMSQDALDTFSVVTASTGDYGLTGPIPEGFLQLVSWSSLGQGNDAGFGTGGDGGTPTSGSMPDAGSTPPPIDNDVRTEETDIVAAPGIYGFSDDTGRTGDRLTSDVTLTLRGTADPGARVEVFEGTTSLGTVTAAATGTWTLDLPALADGEHQFTAVASDDEGTTSEISLPYPVTIDTTAPATPVITAVTDDTGTGGDGITSDATLTLTGTAEAGATIEVFDGAVSLGTATADETGAWTFTTAPLADGQHSLTAVASDAAGNASAASNPVVMTVDTVPPGATVITGFSNDTGAAGDGITGDNTLVITGTAEAGATVTILNGGAVLGKVAANGAGAWSFTTGVLADGGYSFTATAQDAAGNQSVSAPLAVTIDTAAPLAPVITRLDDDTGIFGDGITQDNTITARGTAEAGATVEVFANGASLGTATANGAGAWSFTAAPLADGAYTFTAVATDAAGNASAASAGVNTTIDTTAPAAPVITGWSDDTGTANDQITSDNTLTLTGTAEAGATVRVSENGVLLGSTVADGAGNWTLTTSALGEGSHTLTALAIDTAGNAGADSAPLIVTVDQTAPGITLTTPISGDGLINGSEDGNVSVSGTATGGQLVTVVFRDQGGNEVSGAAVVDGSGNWTLSGTDISALQDGSITVEAFATDAAGNQSVTATQTVTLDSVAPAAPVITGYTDDTGLAGDGLTSDATVTLTGTAEAGATVQIFDQATLLGSTTADAGGAWTFTTGTLADGSYSFVARATDAAGNIGTVSTALPVSIDTVAPGLTVTTPISGDSVVNAAESGAVSLSGTASGGQRVTVTFRDSGGATVTADAAVFGGAWTLPGTDISGLQDGAITVEVRAVDQAGNQSATITENLTLDATPPAKPVISGFSDDTGNADGQTSDNTLTFTGTAEAGATVNVYRAGVIVATGTADAGGNWSATTGVMPDGYTSFTARAVDAASNGSVFSDPQIVIIDTTPPGVPAITGFGTDTGTPGDGITADSTITLSGTAQAGTTTVVIYDNGSEIGTAAVSGGTWTYTTAALADGTHSFTAAGRDYVGNESAASAPQVVTVDATAPGAPVITGFSDDTGVGGDNITNDTTLVLTGTAEANASVEIFNGGASLGTATADGAGNWSFATATLPQGTYSFTARATDGQGNTGPTSSTFTVTVDLTAPSAPLITGFSDDTGVADGRTSDTTLTFTGTAAPNTTVELFDGAASLGTVTADGSGAWTFTTGVLAEGAHSFTATATDAAGNTSASSGAYPVTVDTAAPAAPVISGISDDTGANGSDGITRDTTLTVSGTAEAFATVEVFNGATSLGTTTADAAGTWQFAAGTFSEGAHNITATARDAAGNTSAASVAYAVEVDTTAPAKAVITGWSDDTGNPDSQTSDNTLTFTGTAEAGSTVNIYVGGSVVATGVADGNGDWTATTGVLADGYTSFTARAVDAAGNTGIPSDPVIVIIDTTPPALPVITGYSDDTGASNSDNLTADTTLTLTGTAAAGTSRVVIYDNGSEIGTAQVVGGTWTFTTAALADGAHSLTAAARDYVGNESAQTASLDVTIDATRPSDPVITGFSEDTGTVGDGATSDTELVLSGTAEANATVTISANSSVIGTATADGAGNWTFTTGTLADGGYTFTASATDAAGNVSAGVGSLSVTVQRTPSDAPVITGIADDTGNGGDNVTSDTTLVISGTSQADAVIEVFDGLTSLGTTTADGSGNWSFTTGVLGEGNHSFRATALAPDSSLSPFSTDYNVTVDTTAPTVAITTPISGDGLINAAEDGSVSVSGTTTGSAQLVTVTFRDGTGATVSGTAATDGAGNWTLTGADISGLQNGNITVEAVASDPAGNESVMQTASITLDNAAPAVPVITGFSDNTGTSSAYTSDTTLTFTGTAEAGATVNIYLAGNIVATGVADGSGNWTATTGELADGYSAFTARAVDAAGNTSGVSAPEVVFIDTVAPALPAITGYSTDSGTPGDGLTNDNTITLTGTGPAGSTIVIYDGGVELGTAFFTGPGTWSFTTASLGDGAHSFTASARDGAGNESAQTASLDITIDTTRPATPVIDGFSDDTGSADNQTSDNTLVFHGTAEAGVTVNIYLGGAVVATGVADGNGDWTAATGTIADGWQYFTARAVDDAGNLSLPSSTLTINVDTTAPGVPAITGYTNDNGLATDDGVSSYNWTQLSGTAAAGTSRVVIYVDGVEFTTASVSGGTWSASVYPLTEGEHVLTVAGRDYVGNESAQSGGLTFTVDQTPPASPTFDAISDDSGTAGDFRTNDDTPTLSGTAEANALVTIRDGATEIGTATADANGDWSFTASTLSEGVHVISVWQTDLAGRTSNYSGNTLLVIDTTAPDAPVITGYSDDTGVPGDGVTSDTTLTLTGTAAANSVVEIFEDGVSLGTVTADGSGNWTYLTGELAEDSYSFTARATDNAGNTSSASAALDVTVSSGPPPATATPVISSYGNDTGATGDGITSDNTIQLTGTAAANASVEVFDGVTSLGTVTADGAGNWTYTTAALSDGAHSFTAVATAPGGYSASDPSAALTVTVDTAAPAKPIIAGFSDDTGVDTNDQQTSDNTLTFTGTAEANATVNFYRNGVLLTTTTADGNGDWSLTTGVLADGYTSFEARAVDAAGNIGAASDPAIVIIDTAPPAAPTIAGYSTDSGVQGDGITRYTQLTLSGSVEGGVTQVVVYQDGVEVGTVNTQGTSWTFTTATLAEGDYSFTAVAVDRAGNQGPASAALDISVDTTAPAVPVILGITDDTGSSATDGITNDNTPTIYGTAEANVTVRIYNGGANIGTTTADGNGDWSYTFGALADAYYSISVRADDAAGNASAQTSPTYVWVDTVAPGAPAISSVSGDGYVNASDDSNAQVVGTAPAGTSRVHVTFRDGSGNEVTGTATVNSGTWILSGADISGFDNGTITIEAYGEDAAGNASSTASDTFTLDNVAPARPDIVSYTDTGIANGQTSETRPTFTGTAEAGMEVRIFRGAQVIASAVADGNGDWSATSTVDLPEGFFSVTARAYDAANNASPADTFSVWIDTTPPEAPTVTSWGTDTGTNNSDGITYDNTLTFTGTRPGATLIEVYEGGSLVATLPMTGTSWSYQSAVLADGNYSFTFVAVDGAGNASPATSPIVITVDTASPAVTISGLDTDPGLADGITSDDTPTITGTTDANATVTIYRDFVQIGTVTADGSGNWSYTDTALANGDYSYTARAQDVAGNIGAMSAGFDVEIVDAPEMGPGTSVVVYTEDGAHPVVHNYLTVTDVEGGGLSGATVRIADSRAGDMLEATGAGGFTVSYDDTTYVLTVSGSGTAADLQSVLRSVRFYSTSDDPNFGGTDNSRRIDFNVYQDGTDIPSNTLIAQVRVDAVNDDPQLAGLPGSLSVENGTAVDFDMSAATFSDPDSGSNDISLSFIAGSGTFTASSGGGVSVGGSGSGTLVLTGTASEIDAYLNTASNIRYTDNGGGAPVQIVANDGGNFGSGGGTDVTVGTVSLNLPIQPDAVADTISGVPVGWTLFDGNGHVYWRDPTDIGWTSARQLAQGLLPGQSYMATVTSQAERDFLEANMASRYYLGANDVDTEGTWTWVEGPEAGTVFWIGNASGSAQNGQYTNWGSGQPSEVNGSGSQEDYLVSSIGIWNDVTGLSGGSYYTVAEAGGNGQLYASATEDAPYTFDASLLLANDGAGATITSVSATSALGATITYNSGAGTITYDATAASAVQAYDFGQTATDTFTYMTDDGSTATVSIDVAGAFENTAPTDYISYIGTFYSNYMNYDPATGHVYVLGGYADSWSDALAEAANADFVASGRDLTMPDGVVPYLATISSAAENNLIRFIDGQNYNLRYIAGTDSDVEGTWTWATGPDTGDVFWQGGSGGSAQNGAYTNWVVNEPGSGNDDYMSISSTGRWEADDGTASRWFIAEIGAPGYQWTRVDEDSVFVFDENWIIGNDGPGATLVSVSNSLAGAEVTYDSQTGQVTYNAQESTVLQALPRATIATDSFSYTLADGRQGVVQVEVYGQDGFTAEGTAGDDTIYYTGDDPIDSLHGGTGYDTFVTNTYSMDFRQTGSNSISGIERVDIGTGNRIYLTAQDVLDMSDDIVGGKTRLTVEGDTSDQLFAYGSGWSHVGTETQGADTYNIFENGNAQLYAHSDIAAAGDLPAVVV